jgi:hypothetical protein
MSQLTNEEFARLEHTRVNMERTKVRSKVSPLQLAMEHMENMYRQQQQLLMINKRLHELYGKSWCYKARRAANLSLHWLVRRWLGIKNYGKRSAS